MTWTERISRLFFGDDDQQECTHSEQNCSESESKGRAAPCYDNPASRPPPSAKGWLAG
ncbi:MAG: hypothetical protein AAF411_01185 [Myxococcota bacterium]